MNLTFILILVVPPKYVKKLIKLVLNWLKER